MADRPDPPADAADASADAGDVPSAAIAQAVGELYGVPPEEFVATRRTLSGAAKAAGDREGARTIGALHRPTVAAWALNQLVRHRPQELAALASVGAALRTAQAQLDVATLTALRGRRDEALDAGVDAVAQLAQEGGRPLTAAGLGEVRATLVASLADPAAAAALDSGALVRALSYAGFGEVEVSDAVAVAGLRPRHLTLVPDPEALQRQAEAERRERIAAAEADLAQAEQRLDEAVEARRRVDQDLLAARTAVTAAKEALSATRRGMVER